VIKQPRLLPHFENKEKTYPEEETSTRRFRLKQGRVVTKKNGQSKGIGLQRMKKTKGGPEWGLKEEFTGGRGR